MQVKRLLVFFTLFVMSFAVFAENALPGAFGVEAGMTREQLEKKVVLDKQISQLNSYKSASAPIQNSKFNSYNYQFSTSGPICRVTGSYIDKHLNTDGATLKSVFTALKQSLTASYKNSKDYDSLAPDSVWARPNDWVMSLRYQDRTLKSYWATQVGSEGLPPGVRLVSLGVRVDTAASGTVYLTYEFVDAEKCNREDKLDGLKGL